jgi:hypothetical protein
LSGESLPSEFNLRIIDIHGKVIHNFSTAGGGEFHIGTNLIEWSPVDSQGAWLTSGIYFYQMNIIVEGEEIKKTGKLLLQR